MILYEIDSLLEKQIAETKIWRGCLFRIFASGFKFAVKSFMKLIRKM